MANPLFGALGGNAITISPQVKQAFQMLKMAQNPQAMLQQIAQTNPQLANVLQMCNGKNPEQLFYSLCRQNGIDPNSILNQLR